MAKNDFAIAENPHDKLLTCLQLVRCIPSLAHDSLYTTSIPGIVSGSEYGCFTLFPPGEKEVGKLLGVGLFSVYDDAWNSRVKLAVEAAWFVDAEAEWEAIESLLNVVRDHGLRDLHLKPETIVPREPLDELLMQTTWRTNHVRREQRALLQARSEGLWSAYTGTTTRQARFADCIQIILPSPVSLAGTEYSGSEPLYRGEGRISRNPYADCGDPLALTHRIFTEGFVPRDGGTFSGTLAHQILHQGYIDSPAVSLTADRHVAVTYATSNGRQPVGVVFSVDPNVLRTHGPIWDSFGSMRASHQAFFESDFQSLVNLVSKCALEEAGQILEKLHAGLSRRSQEYSESLQIQAPINVCVGEDIWSRAEELIGEESLASLCSVLEQACPLRDQGSVTTTTVGSPYSIAYKIVEAELRTALEEARKQNSPWQHPGWDTTVFGYMAKTCRDREFFSSGAIPPNAIIEARIVRSPIEWGEPIANPNWSPPPHPRQ